MRVAERVDEFAGLQAGHLRHHHRQQRIGGDVEGHAEEDVGGALVELAGEPPLRDIELEEAMAGGSAILSMSAGFQALTISRRESGFLRIAATTSAIWSIARAVGRRP